MTYLKIVCLCLIIAPITAFNLKGRSLLGEESSIGTLPYIVGGSPSCSKTPSNHPYVVALVSKSGLLLGGGVLIGPQHVLTSASLVTTNPVIPRMTANIGACKLDEPEEAIVPTSVDLHPGWKRDHRRGYDLAVLKLSRPASTQPVKLPEYRIDIAEGEVFQNLGWGRTSPRGPFASILQQAFVAFVPNHQCQSYGLAVGLTDSMMCLGTPGLGICDGDSGSPVIHTASGSEDVLIGIGSFRSGRGCNSYGSQSIYTRVDMHLSWLNTVLSE